MTLLEILAQFQSGLVVTLLLMLFSLSAGLLLAVGMTCILYSEVKFAKWLVNALIFFIRGTPLLVQIFIIYFGLAQFTFIRDSFLWYFLAEPFVCAVLALAINTACYTTILFMGAIASVPNNEKLACDALGMPKWLAFRRIILKRAWRIVLPAYSNEMVIILKGTSLASTITLLDLMGVTQQMIAVTYDTISLYLMVAAIYLALNCLISAFFKSMQKIA